MPMKGEVLSFQAATAQRAEIQTEVLCCDNENRNAYKVAQNVYTIAEIGFKVLYGCGVKKENTGQALPCGQCRGR